jgi:hypothetical protein
LRFVSQSEGSAAQELRAAVGAQMCISSAANPSFELKDKTKPSLWLQMHLAPRSHIEVCSLALLAGLLQRPIVVWERAREQEADRLLPLATFNSPSPTKASCLNIVHTQFETYEAVAFEKLLNHYNALVPFEWLGWLQRKKLIPTSFAARTRKLTGSSDDSDNKVAILSSISHPNQ